MLLTRQGISLGQLLRHPTKPVSVALTLHVAKQMGLYLHRQIADVWRVVSEDTDVKHQSFLLIGCTGRIVTAISI